RTWAVAARESDELVANISVMDLAGMDPTSGEIGYWAHPAARGNGFMTEATRLVADHAFTPAAGVGMGLRRLSLYAAAGNAASNAVARKSGFVETGLQRAAELLGDGSYDDLRAYDVLR
ncbi:MAG TPA: GNAT family N-acetyltransferase, partial [Aeromicrobium sp.]|nr:GNAT family N-acetyltransferase [Aeromicrobium sp.]